MKKKIIYIGLILILTMICCSCKQPQVIDNYKNNIVVDKYFNNTYFGDRMYYYKLKYIQYYTYTDQRKNCSVYRIRSIRVIQYDYNRYSVGDTIK